MRLSVDCMMNGDNPSARQGSTTGARGRRFSLRRRHLLFPPVRKRSTQAADTAWDKMVASAAPRTPRLSPKMKMGSSTMFKPAPMRVVRILMVVNPWAVIYAFMPRVT